MSRKTRQPDNRLNRPPPAGGSSARGGGAQDGDRLREGACRWPFTAPDIVYPAAQEFFEELYHELDAGFKELGDLIVRVARGETHLRPERDALEAAICAKTDVFRRLGARPRVRVAAPPLQESWATAPHLNSWDHV